VNGNHDVPADPNDPVRSIFGASIVISEDETVGQVLIDTHFCPPVYKEKEECGDECEGTLQFCVEIQAIICDTKMDFVDVAVGRSSQIRSYGGLR
jgi:hypothetical protein